MFNRKYFIKIESKDKAKNIQASCIVIHKSLFKDPEEAMNKGIILLTDYYNKNKSDFMVTAFNRV